LEKIGGKTPFIFKEIWVIPNLNGIIPFIFKLNEISIQTEPKNEIQDVKNL
jgi:hypothetical protein